MEKANMKDHLNINFDLIEKMTEIKKYTILVVCVIVYLIRKLLSEET